MRLGRGWRMAALLLLALAVAMAVPACTSSSTGEESGSGEEPVSVEYPDGGDVATITLTEDAAGRLDLQTAPVVSAADAGSGQTVIPYSAVLYDPSGDTWTYTSPEHLVFVRAPIHVKRIDGQSAILVSGPPVGTEVVTVGESELLGSEYEVGGE